MEQLLLAANYRDLPTKGENKRLRKAGKLPAVIYGKGIESKPVEVDYREFNRIMATYGSNALITLETKEGNQTVMVREIQRHPVKNQLLHVDFIKIALDEKIETTVPIALIGDAEGVLSGGILQHQLRELRVEVLPTEIPESIEVDISGLKIGESLKVSDIGIVHGVEILNDGEETVASVLAPKVEAEEPEEAVEELDQPKEPEVVAKEKDEE